MQGRHLDWNTLIYNFGRREVANFLLANALFWLDRYGVDGLRVDAVASMLYLDYSRPQGGNVIWVEFASGVDPLKLHREALKHRINTAPGALFSVKARYNNCLRMSCGLPWSDEVEAALKKLAELVKKQL